MARVKGLPSREAMGGAEGLVVSIIHQAFADAHSDKPEIKEPARQWFKTEDYQTYLSWLGLPEDWQPEL